MIEKRTYIVQPTEDWEEQDFANSVSENALSMAKPKFLPVPPHVGSTPVWEPKSTIPPFQKHPERHRP